MFPRPRYVFLDNHGAPMDDRGTVSTEYAVGLIVAAAAALGLLMVVQSDSFEAGLTSVIERAFDFTG